MRRVRQEDNSAVIKLINSIMNDEFNESVQTYDTDDIEDICSHYEGRSDVFYVAEEPGAGIIGTVGIKNDGPFTALLRRLFLKKEFRGKGYGSELVRCAVDFCRKQGYKKIIFRGTSAMSGAYKTCLKNGFSEKEIFDLPNAKMFVLERSL